MTLNTLNRTNHPKYTTYWGDGSGRDSYVIMNNGSLHGLRDYKGSQPNGFQLSPRASPRQAIARRDERPVEYMPDGSGRDTYIINAYGFKRNYRDPATFQSAMRGHEPTPTMDLMQKTRSQPFQADITAFQNWPSVQQVRDQQRLSPKQRASIERLTQSPSRTSPLSKYLAGEQTFKHNPKENAKGFLRARASSTFVHSPPRTAMDSDDKQMQKRRVSLPTDGGRDSQCQTAHGRTTENSPQKAGKFDPIDLKTLNEKDSKAFVDQYFGAGKAGPTIKARRNSELPKLSVKRRYQTKEVGTEKKLSLEQGINLAMNLRHVLLTQRQKNASTTHRRKPESMVEALSPGAKIGKNVMLEDFSSSKITNNNDPRFFFRTLANASQ